MAGLSISGNLLFIDAKAMFEGAHPSGQDDAHLWRQSPPGMISFAVPGDAVPFARAGSKGTMRFTPPKQRSYEGTIKTIASYAMNGRPPLKGPIHLMIRAEYLAPKSWSKKRRAVAIWKESKPDADNIAKIFKDAMNKIVFEDDAQVAFLVVQKRYGEFSRVTVAVMGLTDESYRA